MEKLRTKTIIEIVGKPKENVEETINRVLSLMKESKKFELLSHEIAEAKNVESGIDQITDVWSTFGEFEVEFPDFLSMTDFCFEFMPSSIEIIEPEKINSDARKIEQSINDILAKLHQYDMALKKIIIQQNVNLKKKEEN